jgi:hypothetical protein
MHDELFQTGDDNAPPPCTPCANHIPATFAIKNDILLHIPVLNAQNINTPRSLHTFKIIHLSQPQFY